MFSYTRVHALVFWQACKRPDEPCVLITYLHTHIYTHTHTFLLFSYTRVHALIFWQACKRPDEPCVLVAAPSNVAVDQMADKIAQTGLKVG